MEEPIVTELPENFCDIKEDALKDAALTDQMKQGPGNRLSVSWLLANGANPKLGYELDATQRAPYIDLLKQAMNCRYHPTRGAIALKVWQCIEILTNASQFANGHEVEEQVEKRLCDVPTLHASHLLLVGHAGKDLLFLVLQRRSEVLLQRLKELGVSFKALCSRIEPPATAEATLELCSAIVNTYGIAAFGTTPEDKQSILHLLIAGPAPAEQVRRWLSTTMQEQSLPNNLEKLKIIRLIYTRLTYAGNAALKEIRESLTQSLTKSIAKLEEQPNLENIESELQIISNSVTQSREALTTQRLEGIKTLLVWLRQEAEPCAGDIGEISAMSGDTLLSFFLCQLWWHESIGSGLTISAIKALDIALQESRIQPAACLIIQNEAIRIHAQRPIELLEDLLMATEPYVPPKTKGSSFWYEGSLKGWKEPRRAEQEVLLYSKATPAFHALCQQTKAPYKRARGEAYYKLGILYLLGTYTDLKRMKKWGGVPQNLSLARYLFHLAIDAGLQVKNSLFEKATPDTRDLPIEIKYHIITMMGAEHLGSPLFSTPYEVADTPELLRSIIWPIGWLKILSWVDYINIAQISDQGQPPTADDNHVFLNALLGKQYSIEKKNRSDYRRAYFPSGDVGKHFYLIINNRGATPNAAAILRDIATLAIQKKAFRDIPLKHYLPEESRLYPAPHSYNNNCQERRGINYFLPRYNPLVHDSIENEDVAFFLLRNADTFRLKLLYLLGINLASLKNNKKQTLLQVLMDTSIQRKLRADELDCAEFLIQIAGSRDLRALQDAICGHHPELYATFRHYTDLRVENMTITFRACATALKVSRVSGAAGFILDIIYRNRDGQRLVPRIQKLSKQGITCRYETLLEAALLTHDFHMVIQYGCQAGHTVNPDTVKGLMMSVIKKMNEETVSQEEGLDILVNLSRVETHGETSLATLLKEEDTFWETILSSPWSKKFQNRLCASPHKAKNFIQLFIDANKEATITSHSMMVLIGLFLKDRSIELDTLDTLLKWKVDGEPSLGQRLSRPENKNIWCKLLERPEWQQDNPPTHILNSFFNQDGLDLDAAIDSRTCFPTTPLRKFILRKAQTQRLHRDAAATLEHHTKIPRHNWQPLGMWTLGTVTVAALTIGLCLGLGASTFVSGLIIPSVTIIGWLVYGAVTKALTPPNEAIVPPPGILCNEVSIACQPWEWEAFNRIPEPPQAIAEPPAP